MAVFGPLTCVLSPDAAKYSGRRTMAAKSSIVLASLWATNGGHQTISQHHASSARSPTHRNVAGWCCGVARPRRKAPKMACTPTASVKKLERKIHMKVRICGGHHVLVDTWIMLGGLPGSSRPERQSDLPAPISAPPPSRGARLGPGTPKCRDGRAKGALCRRPPPVGKMISTDQ